MGPGCTADSADKPQPARLLDLPADSACPPAKAEAAAQAAQAETGENLKVRAGKTAGKEAYSESALSTRKITAPAQVSPAESAEKLLHQHLPVHPAKSADS